MRANKLISQPVNNQFGRVIPSSARESNELHGVGLLGSGNLIGGMNSSIDPADIEENELTIAKNVEFYNDKLKRRPGTSLFAITKPNSYSISKIAEYIAVDSTHYLMRHTDQSVHYAGSASWNALTGSLTPNSERHRVAIINDNYFFTNGINKIQVVDFSAGTFGDLGNAGAFRFIAGFADRLFAAWETGVSANPIKLAFSGNKNYDEWSALTDFSAGNYTLTQSSSGLSDFITGGIHPVGDYLVIVRDRSIWVGLRNPSASDPLILKEAVPGIGSILPDAIARAGDSLFIPDYRSENVFIYTPLSSITPIGDKVKKGIFSAIADPAEVFGGFHPYNATYYLAIPAVDYIKVWKFNLRSKAWSYDEYPDLSAISDIDTSTFSLTIDELPGMIDDLPGVIDDLGISSKQPPKLFFGYSNGELANPGSSIQDHNQNFSHEIVSKTFHEPTQELNIQSTRFTIIPYTEDGVISLYYSKDGGNSFSLIRTWTITSDQVGKTIKVKRQRSLTSDRFQFKLVSTDCQYEIIEYAIIKSIGGSD